MALEDEIRRETSGHSFAPDALTEASRLAERMPLVNFPARRAFHSWNAWSGLKSPESLGDSPRSSAPADVLDWRHVFLFAGPCCYLRDDQIGDSAAYFRPGCEADRIGEASPFDSGSLIGENPCLQPWAGQHLSTEDRMGILASNTSTLAHWRRDFSSWLAWCYPGNQGRYLDTSGSRWNAGLPDRTVPASLRDNNGSAGLALHGSAADRRAWTFEVRIAGELPFRHLQAIHVAPQAYEKALLWRDRVFFSAGPATPEVVPLRYDTVVDPEVLFRESGPLVRKLIGSI